MSAEAASTSPVPKRGFHWQSRTGRYTFPRHCAYSAMDGLWQGAVSPAFFAFLCIKYFNVTAHEEELYSFLLTWFPSLLMLSAPMWDRPFGRSSRYWLFCGVTCRLGAGVVLALVNAPWQLVFFSVVVGVLSSGVSPLHNAMYATNYGATERERAHGLAKMLHILTYVGANFGLAAWLEVDRDAFRWALPITGLLAFLGILAMGSVRMRRIPQAEALESAKWRRAPRPWEDVIENVPQNGAPRRPNPFRTLMFLPLSPARMGFEGLWAPYRRTTRLLRRNRDFAIFELGFMLYGCGFMMLQPVIPTFSKHVLNLDFVQFSTMTSLVFMGTMFVMHPLMRGRTGRMSAAGGAGLAFGLVMGFPLLLYGVYLTESFHLALVAFGFWGIAMMFVDYAWNFGPVKFAKGRDAMPFVSAHAMMVGLRALIAFPAAYFLKRQFEPGEYTWNLLIPAMLLGLAVLTTVWLALRQRAKPAAERV